MPTVISGDTGIDKVQDGVIGTADLASGAITAAKLSGAQSGSAPVYGARAWCVFNGATAGTNAPTAGGNVSTVTRNSAGNYTVNFNTAMPDANFALVGNGVVSTAICFISATASSVTFSSNSTSSGAAVDSNPVQVVILR